MGYAKAANVKRAYPVSPYIQSASDTELKGLLKLGVIEPSESDWVNPVVVLRMCLDARLLNDVTVIDRYPLPHIGRTLSRSALSVIYRR